MGDMIYDDTYETVDPPSAEHQQAFGKAGPMPLWYHANISRESVEKKLKKKADGTFIIRDSGSSQGDFVMSVSESGVVRHYIIQRSGPTSFVLSENTFTDLVDLIAFYRLHILDSAALTVPVPFEEALKNGVQIRAFYCTAKAKYNFTARDDEDLSFHKGELLNIIEKHEPEWWRAQSQSTLEIGVIPANYVTEVADGPIRKAEKEAAAAAKKRAEMLAEAAAAPLPPVVPSRSTKLAPSKMQEEEAARRRDAEDEANRREKAAKLEAERRRLEEEDRRREAEERAAQEAHERREREELQRLKQEEEARRKEDERLAKERAEQKKKNAYKPPERPKFIVVKADLDRNANVFDKSALTFRQGDLIQVNKQFENGLWVGQIMDGRRMGRKGHFPFTFVEILDSAAFDEDTKKVETEFKIKMLEQQGVDVTKLLKAGQTFERPPAVPSRGTKAPPAASSSASPPPIPGRDTKSPKGRAPAPAPPPTKSSRAPAPAPPSVAAESDYDDYEEDIYGGTAELFDQGKIDEMMEEIYGAM